MKHRERNDDPETSENPEETKKQTVGKLLHKSWHTVASQESATGSVWLADLYHI